MTRHLNWLEGIFPLSNPETQAFGIDKVVLTVRDLHRVADFYRRDIGLHVQRDEGATLLLGSGAQTMLEVRHDPHARPHSVRDAGLFHTAFLLPTRAALGAWIRHAFESQVPITGAADHLVSEAIYLNDPEGNGVEVYADRPRSQWNWTNGAVHMATDPLDLQGIVASAEGLPWNGAPEGSVVGHVHLQVGALPEAESYYAGVLGLDITCRYPGAVFYSSGGYHHHIATNIWNSRGALPRADGATGLSGVQLSLESAQALDDLRLRVSDAGLGITEQGHGFQVKDPWNTPFTFAV